MIVWVVKNLVNAMFIIFVMFASTGVASARFDEMSPVEWGEYISAPEIVESPVAPPLAPTPEQATEVNEAPVFRCEGSHINYRIFWVPMSCFDADALGQVAAKAGTSDLFCQQGYFGADDEMTVAIPGAGEDGWASCWDLVQ